MRLFAILGLAAAVAGAQAQQPAIDLTQSIPAPVSEVWKAWTTEQGLKDFLGIGSKIELKFGGRYEFFFDQSKPVGSQGGEGNRVLSFVPERMLSFSWNSPPSLPSERTQRTYVVLCFEPDGNQTKLSLYQSGFQASVGGKKSMEYFQKAWPTVLELCRARFASGKPAEITIAAKPNAEPDLAPLKEMERMIGGTWKGTVKSPDGDLIVEFTYKRHPDGKGVLGEGVIGKGKKDAMFVKSQFGWDPVAKAVYYFDTHNSETLYFGHVVLDQGDMVFTFSPIGMLPQVFSSRGRLVDNDTYQTLIENDKGEKLVGFTLKRSK